MRQLGSPEQVAREVLGGGFAPAQESAGAPKRSRGLISAIAMICAAPIALPLMAAGVLVVFCMALAALLCVGGLLVAAVAVVVMGGASMGAALFTGGLGAAPCSIFWAAGWRCWLSVCCSWLSLLGLVFFVSGKSPAGPVIL